VSAKRSESQIIYIYSDSELDLTPQLVGKLRVSLSRGEEIFSFEYDQAYLESPTAFNVDPDLQLVKGPQFVKKEKRNFGVFQDSAPDRWGRFLMDKREIIKARLEERPRKRFMESDYLLKVHDDTRMGAFRLKNDPKGPFLDNATDRKTPPITSVRELEQAVVEFEKDTTDLDQEWLSKFQLLIAPGSSLGGARPKANVRDQEGDLWIAKFPSMKDDLDSGLWEFIAYKLATQCGIWMSESAAKPFYSNSHTFLSKRFDRTRLERHHFFSAMTLLGYQDGANAQIGVSYLELVDLIRKRGSKPEIDLEQLWRRMIFSICISNTDDHLRNHGFLWDKKGIRLSPAYDINPNPLGTGLSLCIDMDDNSLSTELALSVSEFFNVPPLSAQSILSDIKKAVGRWHHLAKRLGLSSTQIEQMSPAFGER
jgi:serine/threonine-protein kinase HipA